MRSDLTLLPVGGAPAAGLTDALTSAAGYALSEKADATRRANRADIRRFSTWCEAVGAIARSGGAEGIQTDGHRDLTPSGRARISAAVVLVTQAFNRTRSISTFPSSCALGAGVFPSIVSMTCCDVLLVATAQVHGHCLLTKRDAVFGAWTARATPPHERERRRRPPDCDPGAAPCGARQAGVIRRAVCPPIGVQD